MTHIDIRPLANAALAAGLVLGLTGSALAFGGGGGGGGNSGSGLSPYAADSGNDRSAGVNNGNYQQPRYNYYRRAYGPRDVPYLPRGRFYQGYPY
ncbi:hypothetical protein [Methylobacterium haplocladii]|uniref:Sulfur globule protein n=1 Tax=Methylobacterium haplocladii TaxID=1176176 RepID=A0A512IUF3_9HYPH|nr:hypothetical protein [Methylobacterium haplocladii]GEP01321.1 hypothetical protein MHA02_37080 [Methylobacterium haplocladii]GJD83865.1 hypothetical protein HPGCJGGD_1738 [Methylobacterium haplocladii]GLS59976.1 hypothetical protein GCM10007887_26510 [Methylobacterium haplocladii]